MNRLRRLLSSSQLNVLHPAFWFGDADVRPLGLFRIAFAALMLKEAIYHIFVAEIWYSDAGMFPVRLLPRVSPSMPTLMSSLNDSWMAVGFFILWALVAILLLVGWQTRVMSVLNLVLLVSVLNRNQLVVTGADEMMEALAFWSLFVPLGRTYSLDARRRTGGLRPATYAFPVRMLQLQIALVYISTTILKLEGQTWLNGDAVYMALQVRMHTFPIAEWLLVHATTSELGFLTYLTLLLEGGFVLLVFAPFGQPYLRRMGLIAGVVLHVGIGVVMNVPNFPLVMVVSYLLLIDGGWMDWLDRYLRLALARIQGRGSQPDLSAPTPQDQPGVQGGCRGVMTALSRGMVQGGYRGAVACGLTAVMAFTVWANLLTNDRLAIRLSIPAMPPTVETGLRAIGLWQSWSMFAPDPLAYEGWFGVNGIFPNGDTYDLRSANGRPHWYFGPEARWGKLEENLMSKDKDDPLFSAWAAYACRYYRPLGLSGIQIALYSRPTSPPDQPFLPYQVVVMRGADCQ